eukprot:CAMPEP_0177772744 /NCGR_PEP_ID=MMETSP0491_2-20121128/12441_1 /TAXON_ID=63592 /ORGANISM="Tetraselmis chuii, Strain PLY429" /LENGTH=158 /DNA_ID=CAMNT_0019290685 /DNA_START=177 /DNA_END=650 /DNA_ORIENTATION=+
MAQCPYSGPVPPHMYPTSQPHGVSQVFLGTDMAPAQESWQNHWSMRTLGPETNDTAWQPYQPGQAPYKPTRGSGRNMRASFEAFKSTIDHFEQQLAPSPIQLLLQQQQQQMYQQAHQYWAPQMYQQQVPSQQQGPYPASAAGARGGADWQAMMMPRNN